MYVTEMKMPSNYSALSIEEMEYDGQGWFKWVKRAISAVAFITKIVAHFVPALAITALVFKGLNVICTSASVSKLAYSA